MYFLGMGATVAWVGDGTGSMFVPGAQQLRLNTSRALIAGGDAPTAATITAAITAQAAALAAIFGTTANLAVMQGWATGLP